MENKISEIESRFNLLITIGIFYPAVVYGFFKFIGKSDADSNSTAITWMALVAFFLVDYVYFEILKSKLGEKYLIWINWTLLFGILAFVFPILIMVSKQNSVNIPNFIVLILSMMSLFVVPSLIFSILIIKSLKLYVIWVKNY